MKKSSYEVFSMKLNKCTLFVVLALIMTLVLTACKEGDTTLTQTQSPPPLNSDKSLHDMLYSVVAHIHEIGLSGGVFSLDGEMENVTGEVVYICSDDTYSYYISSDFHLIIATLKDLDSMYSDAPDTIAIKEDELVEKGYDLIPALFPYLNPTYLRFAPDFDFDSVGSVRVLFLERVDDCLVNIGSLELSKLGTPISFSATCNSIDDFKDSNRFLKDEIYTRAYEELLEGKEIVEVSGGFDTDGIIGLLPPGGDWVGFENIDGGYPQEFKLYLETQSDVSFIRVEKEIANNGTIIWIIEAQIKTSWGEIDSMFDYIWYLKIDADSGERVGDFQVLPGSQVSSDSLFFNP